MVDMKRYLEKYIQKDLKKTTQDECPKREKTFPDGSQIRVAHKWLSEIDFGGPGYDGCARVISR